jgi:hypothetical protein
VLEAGETLVSSTNSQVRFTGLVSYRQSVRAKREQLEIFQGLSPGSHGRNLALTVLYVPYSAHSELLTEVLEAGETLVSSTNSQVRLHLLHYSPA